MIERWHIPISGFTQSIDRANGFDRLWKKLRPLVSESCSLLPPQRWNADFSAIAEFVHRMRPQKSPDIRVYAYSWGCGHGFMQLAKELKRRGLSISHAVLSDPVFHSWWRPWRSVMTGKWSPPIIIPENVHQVYWFYQRQNRPQATELIAKTGVTVIHAGVRLERNHEWMDDAPEFWAKCLEIAEL